MGKGCSSHFGGLLLWKKSDLRTEGVRRMTFKVVEKVRMRRNCHTAPDFGTVEYHPSDCHSNSVVATESVRTFPLKSQLADVPPHTIYKIIYTGRNTMSVYDPLLAGVFAWSLMVSAFRICASASQLGARLELKRNCDSRVSRRHERLRRIVQGLMIRTINISRTRHYLMEPSWWNSVTRTLDEPILGYWLAPLS